MGLNSNFGPCNRLSYPKSQNYGQGNGAQAKYATFVNKFRNPDLVSQNQENMDMDAYVKALRAELSELQLVNHQLRNQNQKLVQSGFPNTASSFFAEYRDIRYVNVRTNRASVSGSSGTSRA